MPFGRFLLLGSLMVALTGQPVQAGALAPLLANVTRNAHCPQVARADLVMRRGNQTITGVLLCAGAVQYLETSTGFRAVSHPHKQAVIQKGHPVRAAVRTQIPGTDWLLEELAFDGLQLAFPQSNDEGPEGVVVSGEARDPSLFVLFVHTIDPERAVITDSKYYKDDIATLMKVRRNESFVQIDGHHRPQRVSIEDYVEHSTTTITLTWRSVAELPKALFKPSGLRHPSGLTIPAVPATPPPG